MQIESTNLFYCFYHKIEWSLSLKWAGKPRFQTKIRVLKLDSDLEISVLKDLWSNCKTLVMAVKICIRMLLVAAQLIIMPSAIFSHLFCRFTDDKSSCLIITMPAAIRWAMLQIKRLLKAHIIYAYFQ